MLKDNAATGALELSLGEKRVRTSFNPGQHTVVESIKQKTAELINICDSLSSQDPRLASIAMTKYEEAAMWAVKAATTVSIPIAPSGAGYVPPKEDRGDTPIPLKSKEDEK